MEKKLQQLTDCLTFLSLVGDEAKWSMNNETVVKYGARIRKNCLRAFELTTEIEAIQKYTSKAKIKK